jgi:hypothetical protein
MPISCSLQQVGHDGANLRSCHPRTPRALQDLTRREIVRCDCSSSMTLLKRPFHQQSTGADVEDEGVTETCSFLLPQHHPHRRPADGARYNQARRQRECQAPPLRRR